MTFHTYTMLARSQGPNSLDVDGRSSVCTPRVAGVRLRRLVFADASSRVGGRPSCLLRDWRVAEAIARSRLGARTSGIDRAGSGRRSVAVGRSGAGPSRFARWRSVADPFGPPGSYVAVDLLQRVGDRCQVAVPEVLGEVLVDAEVVDFAGGLECFDPFGGDEDSYDASIVGRSLSAKQPSLLHPIHDAGEAALAREDPRGEFVHRQPARLVLFGGLFEVDEHVVPAQRQSLRGLQLVIDDVDQRHRGLEEDSPLHELIMGRT